MITEKENKGAIGGGGGSYGVDVGSGNRIVHNVLVWYNHHTFRAK